MGTGGDRDWKAGKGSSVDVIVDEDGKRGGTGRLQQVGEWQVGEWEAGRLKE